VSGPSVMALAHLARMGDTVCDAIAQVKYACP